VWSKRFEQINDFERMLTESGVRILKFFLWIGKDEQKKRFEARLDDPTKNWKFSADDTKERKFWDEYIVAYEDMLAKCSTEAAPWYVVPANHKWFRNLAVAQILRDEMRGMKLAYPRVVK
jgi:polyphosphate kinase 2 (PPK2 family)